jgi:hypothetical protein
MEQVALYLLKSAAWLTAFTLVYLLFLQKERFFMLKRIYFWQDGSLTASSAGDAALQN